MKAMLASAAFATSLSLTAVVTAQDFPPFPEPAVGPFPDTDHMTLLSQLLPAEIGALTPRAGVLLNDIWGWTSPNGEDYALVGTGDGMAVVRVTDPENPEHLGILPTPSTFNNLWGDIGVYTASGPGGSTSYAYFTTEADGTGINILELNQLDFMGPAMDPSEPIPPSAIFSGGGYDSAHNIYVNQETGFAYVAGVGLTGEETACNDDPFHPSRFNTLILDLKPDPLDPVIVACRADAGEHDFYVVNYRGPDRDYRGREIAFVFDGRDKDALGRGGKRVDDTPGFPVGGTTEIWDVTDKSNIHVIASFTVPGICFSHQGWTASNRHEFLLINDELDELRDAEEPGGFFRTLFCQKEGPAVVPNPGLFVVNVKDLDNPFLQERFFVESPGDNDHNFVRRGNKLFWAVYNAGTRVLKMRNKRGELQLAEFARLDSEPRDAPVFFGQWGIFPFSESETIVASDINNGLMVMRLGRDELGENFVTSSAPAVSAIATAEARAAAARMSLEEKAARRAALIEHIKSRLR